MISNRLFSITVVGVILLVASPAAPQTPTVPVGPNFQADTITAYHQVNPDIDRLPDGGFVVTWTTLRASGLPDSIEAQRFDSAGSAVGLPIQVKNGPGVSETFSELQYPRVRADEEGGFVVAWLLDTTTTDTVHARFFLSNGTPVGEPFPTEAAYRNFDIVTAPDGTFLLVRDGGGIQGRRYSSTGDAMGDPIAISSPAVPGGSRPSVARLPDNKFSVVWHSLGSVGDDDSDSSIQGVLLDSEGAPTGSQFQVNSYSTGKQVDAFVTAGANGEFVVSFRSDGTSFRRFSTDGVPLGEDTAAEPATIFGVGYGLRADADGDFVMIWAGELSEPFSERRFAEKGIFQTEIFAHRFASDGSPIGGEFQVNTYTTGWERYPAVAVADHGDFVVAWNSQRAAAEGGYSIQAQRFRVTADIGDRVWLDEDGDGIQDPGEPGVPDVLIRLKDGSGELLASTRTDEDGHFLFRPKIALEGVVDKFYLKFVAPHAMALTRQDVGLGSFEDADSDADPLSGNTAVFMIESAGEVHLDIDAGLVDDSGIFSDGFESGDLMAWSSASAE